MANSRAAVEEVKDEVGLSWYGRKQGHAQRIIRTCQKDTEASVIGLLAKLGKFEQVHKIMMATNYRPLNKMETTSSC
jgi:hypothetical protein